MNIVYTSGFKSVESPRFFNPEMGFSDQKFIAFFSLKLVHISYLLVYVSCILSC